MAKGSSLNSREMIAEDLEIQKGKKQNSDDPESLRDDRIKGIYKSNIQKEKQLRSFQNS